MGLFAKLVPIFWALLLSKTQQLTTDELMWSTQPLSEARLRDTGGQTGWMDVSNTSVTVNLPNELNIMIAYHLSARAMKPFQPGADFIRDYYKNPLDFLQCRLVVDDVPYRQSSTFAAPSTQWEQYIAGLTGHLVIPLGTGLHNVKLQWKKTGNTLTSWSNLPNSNDGFTSGRSIVITAQQMQLWYVYGNDDVVLQSWSTSAWKAIPDTFLSFELPEDSTLRIQYSMTAHADQVNASTFIGGLEEVSARVVVDGMAYREGSSSFALTTKTAVVGILGNELYLYMAAGSHMIQLE